MGDRSIGPGDIEEPGQARPAEETPFVGGNLSASVRVGDTVRRRSGPWTPAVQALLGHLQRVQFDAAPTPLGIDDQGREMLTFLPGDTHVGWPKPMTSWMFEDEDTLLASARLLRRYHGALEGFVPPTDARWRIVAPGRHEVICHNDWAPYNAVFRGRVPIGMLDWDLAGPGSRAWDVARSAYTWVPLYPKAREHTLAKKARRLALFCEAYANDVRPDAVFDVLIEQLRFFADFVQNEADAGDPGFSKLVEWHVPAGFREDAELLLVQRSVLVGQP